MKVLLLPLNVASDLSHKVRALKEIGVNARGLTFGGSQIQTAVGVKVYEDSDTGGFRRYFNRSLFFKQMYEWIKWADVLHWYWSFGSSKIDKKIVQWFDKPGVVQWGGSDIRIPEAEAEVNPYYREAFSNGYEYKALESRENSLKNQRDFADVGFFPLEFIGFEHHIDKELFPKRFRVWQSVVLAEHTPNYPDAAKKKPLLLHAPSAPVTKGTKYVLRAVEQLKSKYDFDFKLIHRIPRAEALEFMSGCDVYIDQLVGGGHGSAAVEAMAFGKPVVCYINPITGKNYPPEMPIFNANGDDLTERLEILIKDGALRRELGVQGRKYVEKYHDDRKIARELVEIYKEVISLHRERRKK